MTNTEASPTPVTQIQNETVIPQLSTDLRTLNLDDLLCLVQDQINLIDFLQSHNLIAGSQTCACCKKMDLKQRDISDKFHWRCTSSYCGNTYSIRKDSIFYGSQIPLKVLLTFLYLWAYKMASYKILKRECRINSNTTIRDWKMLVRNVCVEHFLRHPQTIGGKGCRVEVDESLFPLVKKTTGRIIEQMWVFGGYEQSTKRGFLVTVPSRDVETLITLIKEFIRPETTIISECWRAEDRLGLEGYEFLRRTHGCIFVDPTFLAVETMWQEAKKEKAKTEHGSNGQMANSYLAEFMWRQKFGNSPLEIIFQHIAEMYPV